MKLSRPHSTLMAMTLTLLAGAGAFSDRALAVGLPFDTAHFSGAANCAFCHNGLRDQSRNDVSLEVDWGATMMAHSSRDPLWQAKVASELARAPALSDIINAKCSRCHMPMANVELALKGDPIEILDGPATADGLLDPSHPLYLAANEGVSCTLCHQIEDDGSLGNLEGFSGHYHIADPAARTLYGPVPNPRINPMQRQSGFTPTHAFHASDSALCATCHNLKTPFVDADGNLASGDPETEFAEQMPYTEWEHSDYATGGATPRSCQSCHMPETDGVKLSNRPRNLRRVDSFSRHRFAGANTTMLDILNRNRSALGVTATNLDNAIADARSMLSSAAEIELIEATRSSGDLHLQLRVINHSGHKLPTSFPSRRVWINLRVTNASDELVFESGALAADGSILGADGDANASTFEPHHDVITEAGQVQIYEPVMGNTDDEVTHTLLRAATYLKDNRLTPAGFAKTTAPSDVAVMGGAAEDSNFDDGSDRVTYIIGGVGDQELGIEVRLYYQTLSRPFLNDLFLNADLPEVARFRSLYTEQAIHAETIAELSFTLN